MWDGLHFIGLLILVTCQFCQLIIDDVNEKNPEANNGWTPLHKAAQNGHLSIRQLIVESIDDKNPKDED